MATMVILLMLAAAARRGRRDEAEEREGFLHGLVFLAMSMAMASRDQWMDDTGDDDEESPTNVGSHL
uniref:Uncharacterized protein n=1 Tax=Leersia perrieri TaxID=77586 RepID=A0A0D9VDB8_9ORYZ